jgi:large subunit ribosomal protein L19
MTNPIVQEIEKAQLKMTVPEFDIGDTVEVRTKVKEGDKERISVFIGTVIGRQGTGVRETFKVRRLVQGEGVERTFPLHSPLLTEVRVRHKGEVRRAKLYYLRRRVGKATRIKGRTVHEVAGSESQPAAEPQPGGEKAPEAKAPAKG